MKNIFSGFGVTFIGLLSIVVTGCIFSPSKSSSDFALSSRVWDGVSVDSSGHSVSLQGLLRIDFSDGDQVQVQVSNRIGIAPYSVSKSGRLSLGFEDEPLRFSASEKVISPQLENWLPEFLAHVDRYKEQNQNLYLRSSAFPDVLLTLGEGDTSVAIGNLNPTKVVKVDSIHLPKLDTLEPIILFPPDTLKIAPLVLPTGFPVYGGSAVHYSRKTQFNLAVNAWKQWSQANIRNYSFDYVERCTCLNNRNGFVSVTEGKANGFIPAKTSVSSIPMPSDLPTVDLLFAQIGLLLTSPAKGGEMLSLTFGTYGEPASLIANLIPDATMDDLSFMVSNFTPKVTVVEVPPIPIGDLVGPIWSLNLLNQEFLGVQLPDIAQVQFFADGTWKGNFICNSYAGTYSPNAAGNYSFTIEPQTFVECGEKQIVSQVMALLQDPVVMKQIASGQIQIVSQDGLQSALLKALLSAP